MIDRGSGTPVVLVPGIQGRWEWMRPAVDALAARCRVLTFSLCDEPTSGVAVRSASRDRPRTWSRSRTCCGRRTFRKRS